MKPAAPLRKPVRPTRWPLRLAITIGVAIPATLVLVARARNGSSGFPLDDTWISLTYARTLAATGRFSYFPGGPLSSGATSPLDTLLLAAGFLVTANEKLLALGASLAAYAAFLVGFGRWAERRLGSVAWAAAALLPVALDGRIAMVAASGMETSLFLLLVTLAFHAWNGGRRDLAALAVAAAIWTRPDGFILAAVFALDLLPARAAAPRHAAPSARGRRLAWALALAALAGYFVFNRLTGPAWLPNTFAAKRAFYSDRPRLAFLLGDVGDCFTSGGWLLLLPFALAGGVRELARLFRRESGGLRAEAAWMAALPLAYFALLPFSHRFHRYLLPALPALSIVGVATLRDAVRALGGRKPGAARARARGRERWAAAAVAVAVLLHLVAFASTLDEYTAITAYHLNRHERTGRWLATHTPPDAVIAAHDVGAIAFYSRRRVVDIVGLVSPEVVGELGRPDYAPYLAGLFERQRVTYIAAFTDWLEVTNARPVFVADPEPEVLCVTPWIPGVTGLRIGPSLGGAPR